MQKHWFSERISSFAFIYSPEIDIVTNHISVLSTRTDLCFEQVDILAPKTINESATLHPQFNKATLL